MIKIFSVVAFSTLLVNTAHANDAATPGAVPQQILCRIIESKGPYGANHQYSKQLSYFETITVTQDTFPGFRADGQIIPDVTIEIDANWGSKQVNGQWIKQLDIQEIITDKATGDQAHGLSYGDATAPKNTIHGNTMFTRGKLPNNDAVNIDCGNL